MSIPNQLLSWIDDEGELQTELFDPNNPEHRRILEENACECPLCADLLAQIDQSPATLNRRERRLQLKLDRVGRRKRRKAG